MPSHKPVKTYQRRTRSQQGNSSKSVDAINALFVQNLTKRLKCRRKAKIKLKELPPRTESYLTDDSLKVEPNNTFDKLLKGKIYNPVEICNLVKISSSCDSSKSTSFHSPIITRKRKNESVVVSQSSESKQEKSQKSRGKNYSDITTSLIIEKEEKKVSGRDLSYIKLPKITENAVMDTSELYRPYFSDTFRERAVVHSSTPAMLPPEKIVADVISPITQSDSSNSSKLIEKSYDHIRKWDENFPKEETPRRSLRLGSDNKGRRRKLITEQDWKLQISPKVYLKSFDRVSPDFRGFTGEEQSSSWEESKLVQSWLNSLSVDYGKAKRKFPSLKYDPRTRITKRKKSTPKKTLKNTRSRNLNRKSQRLSKQTKRVSEDSPIKTRSRRRDGSNFSKKEEQSRSRRSTLRAKSSPIKTTKRKTPPKKKTRKSTPKSEEKTESKLVFSDSSSILRSRLTRVETRSKSRGTTNKKGSIDVTEDILSEKEMSYPQSESFDFSSDSKNPEKESYLTVDLQTFDSFVQNYTELENVSVVTVSDDSAFGTPPPKTLKTPNIHILSNISLGRSLEFNNREDTVRKIIHDHSYTSPIPKPRPKTTPPACSVSVLSDIIESSMEPKFKVPNLPPTRKDINLKPGKSYRRSLALLRRSSVLVEKKDCGLNSLTRKKIEVNATRGSPRKSVLEIYARGSLSYVQGEDFIENLDESVQSLTLNARRSLVTARDLVLRRCGQTEVLKFDECYPPSALQNCQKIGEGVYGEVFLYRNPNGGTSVMKVIPIEGDLIVNGERQKKFEEILSEIIIAMELSNLKTNKKNTTGSFSEVQKIRCMQGNYPDRLLDLWELYDETRGSENDSPQMFSSDQLYVVLELANGGKDVESFVFNNAVQAFAMFKQTACALAVAETQLKFEHRDLHWGNVLVSGVDKKKTITYRINGKEIEVDSAGIEVAIIDFTLSRIEYDGVVIFNDLSLDNELFAAKGDYQFEIYRLMQKSNGNEWQHFEPYSNVLWLHYLLDKVPAFRYRNVKSKIHQEFLDKLKKLKEEVLSFNSAADFVREEFF